jgi:hypothetical protein
MGGFRPVCGRAGKKTGAKSTARLKPTGNCRAAKQKAG